MFPIIDLGPLAIQTAGLILILSLWFGVWLTGIFSDSLGTNHEDIENSLLFGVIAGIVSARIGFLLQHPSIFLENPLSLVSLTPSMLNTDFGVLIGFLSAVIFAQKKHLPLLPSLDTAAPLIILMFAGLHLANLANGDAYGLPTDLPWGIKMWNAARHPVQLYALIMTLALFIWFIIKTKGLKTNGFLRSGILCQYVIAVLALITLITRAFVEEKTRFAGIDLLQGSSYLILTGNFILIYHRLFSPRKHISVFISLGSNFHPQMNLPKALARITNEFNIRNKSSLYKTRDVNGNSSISTFYNQVIEIGTDYTFPNLREALKSIEQDLGRKKGNKQQVPIDLDILTYNGDVFIHEKKHIPDPNLTRYHYIVKPLAEISPTFRHPATGKSIHDISLEIAGEAQEVERVIEVADGIKR
jgi:2-amino-4-hydroxy-6-hydroxymethyldihydropteridine diphosphokinase